MKEIKKVSIIGLGALGVMFGHHLSKKMSSEHLRIVADPERVQKYQNNEIYCNGERCQFNYITPEDEDDPADLVIFAVKYSGLEDAMESVRNQIGDETIILSALNGVTSESIIGEKFGMDRVLYCVAQGMDTVKAGNKVIYSNMGMLCFGDKEPGEPSEKVQTVARFFDNTDFPYEIDTNMKKRQWGKFMVNVGVNQTVAVYKSNYGEIQQEGPARTMMIAAMREVMALTEVEGTKLSVEDLAYWLKVLGTLSPHGKPSMAQDVEAKRHSEVELFSGTVLKLGKKYGVPTPINQELYNRITTIEKDY